MSNDGGLLNPEEVDFLLQQGMGDEADVPATVGEGQEVTMRGDLDQINLADIFQTLAISKMEGVLRIRNPLQSREIYFKDGLIRCLVPPRLVTRRLGQWLIKAGLISGEELREALLMQQQSAERKHLGQILIDNGWVEAESLENVALSQITEDLFGIFTWKHGSFEFYKGPASDTLLRERLDSLPQFEVNGVLLEVARRSDEWEGILAALGSLEDVPVVVPGAQGDESLGQNLIDLLEQVDGSQSYRDLAESSLLGLFEGCTAAKGLIERDLIEPASAEQLLETADQRITRGELRRAQVMIQTLHEREDLHSRAQLIQMAELLKRCNEGRRASYMLLEAARNEPDAQMRTELASKAFKLNRRDLPVVENYYQVLLESSRAEDKEVFEVANALVDALTDAGELDQALRILGEQDARTPGVPGLMGRRAIALYKLGRTQEAVETWLEVAAIREQQGDRDQLIEAYESILKIDHEQKDVAKALRMLKQSRLRRLRNKLIATGMAAAVLLGGFLWWQADERAQVLADATSNIEGMLARVVLPEIDDRDGAELTADQRMEIELKLQRCEQILKNAQQALQAAAPVLEGTDDYDSLSAKVTGKAGALTTSRGRFRDGRRSAELEAALQEFRAGNVALATTRFEDIAGRFKMGKKLNSWLNPRIGVLVGEMDTLVRELPFKIPDPPTELADTTTITAGLEDLREAFQGDLGTQYQGIAEAGQHEAFAKLLAADRLERLTELATQLSEIYSLGRVRLAEYERAAADRDTARRLEPLFVQAQAHEAAHSFREALEAYRRLVAEHPRDDEIKAHFQEQLRKYATIQRLVEALETATREGDFVTARNQLRALQRSWQEIPFEDLVLLPLTVNTRPAGARVIANGEEVGTSPLLLAYRPAETTEIRIELSGFLSEAATVTGDSVGRLESLLVKASDWTTEARGSIQATGLNLGNRLLFTDRSGHLTALAITDGQLLWSIGTDDLSGLLTQPVALSNETVVFGSVDGPLRAYDVNRGRQVWEADNAETECPPAVAGSYIAVVTTGQELVVIRPNGSRHTSLALPQPVQAGVIPLRGNHVFIACENGLGLAVDCATGKVEWQAAIPKGALAAPLLLSDGVVVAGDNGVITLLDPKTGRPRWTASLEGETTLPSCQHGKGLFVVHGDKLSRLDLATGRESADLASPSRWTSAPAAVGQYVVAGTDHGRCVVMDPDTLEIQFQLQGSGRIRAQPLAVGKGGVAVFSEGREALWFRQLP